MPDSKTTSNFLQNAVLAAKLRRHFGEKFHGEPTMSFFPDGSVQVRVGGNVVDLTKEEAEAFNG